MAAPRRPRPSFAPFDLFSFAMAGLLLVSAVLLLEGSLFRQTLKEARVMFGIVLLLLGIYRIVVTVARRRAAREEAVMAELRAEVRAEVQQAARPDGNGPMPDAPTTAAPPSDRFSAPSDPLR